MVKHSDPPMQANFYVLSFGQFGGRFGGSTRGNISAQGSSIGRTRTVNRNLNLQGAVMSASSTARGSLKVLVYSSNSLTRTAVITALGRRPAPELPQLEYIECATEPAVIKHMDAGGIDLAILDGEAVPSGGMGIARQLRDEIYKCPPLMVLIGRPQDAWLATWSRADGVVSHPLDPLVLAEAVATLLRQAVAGRNTVTA